MLSEAVISVGWYTGIFLLGKVLGITKMIPNTESGIDRLRVVNSKIYILPNGWTVL